MTIASEEYRKTIGTNKSMLITWHNFSPSFLRNVTIRMAIPCLQDAPYERVHSGHPLQDQQHTFSPIAIMNFTSIEILNERIWRFSGTSWGAVGSHYSKAEELDQTGN